MKDSKSLQPAWVFPPFLYWVQFLAHGLLSSLRSKECSVFIFQEDTGRRNGCFSWAQGWDLQRENLKTWCRLLILKTVSWSIPVPLTASWLILYSFMLPWGLWYVFPQLPRVELSMGLRSWCCKNPEHFMVVIADLAFSAAGVALGTRVKLIC